MNHDDLLEHIDRERWDVDGLIDDIDALPSSTDDVLEDILREFGSESESNPVPPKQQAPKQQVPFTVIPGGKPKEKTSYQMPKPKIVEAAEKPVEYGATEEIEIPELKVGDRISHKKFGEGEIISVGEDRFSAQFAEGIKTLIKNIVFPNHIVTLI